MRTSIISILLASLLLGACGAPVAGADMEGAKSLFLQQIGRPEESLNLGVQYWIELHRGSQVMQVNNKTAFKSGDRIRFHVKPNINGYAYILLQSGSRGEKSVLFPDPARGESNRVTAGNDYLLPAVDFLEFDQNPGLEKLTLLVSRTPVDATSYLTTPESDRILVASAATGSKDLVPSKIILAIAPVQPAPAPVPVPAVAPAVKEGKPTATAGKRGKKPANKVTTKPGTTGAGATKPAAIKPVHRTPVGTPPVQVATGGTEEPAPTILPVRGAAEDSAVTIVKRDPTGVLAVDIALEHL